MFSGTWRMMKVPDRMHGEQGHLDIMDGLGRPPGRYPECFVLILLLEVCQEWGVKKLGTLRILRVPDRHLEGRVILDILDDLGKIKGSYPESFVSISLFLAE